ncbi:Co2+/Mg2+ efflux protein ApaG [Phycisphaeraceae bacterium D3-23]
MNATLISDTTTHGIRVGAAAFYLPDPSVPEENKYVFGYRVVILNAGDQGVQLLRRHWDIIDGDGTVKTVDGKGVVGEQPELEPGEAFKYESFAVLPTPWGTMEGYYEMQDDVGETLRVAIGRFFLTEDSSASGQGDTP